MTSISIIAILAFTAVSSGLKVQDVSKVGPSTRVAMACSKNLWCALPILAEKKGFFDAHRLDVDLTYVQAAKFAMDALVSGSSDVAGVVETNVAFLGFTGNKDVRLVTTIVHSHDGGIVARRSAGIVKPEDLAGKKIGVLKGTTSQIFADRFFKKYRLEGRVEIVNLQPVAIQTAVVDGSIPAGSVWQPLIYNVIQATGGDALVFQDPEVYVGTMNVATRRAWADSNPAAIDAFIASLQEALEFAQKRPAEAQATLAAEIDIPIETLAAIWNQYDYGVSMETTSLAAEIRRQGKWIVQTQPGFSDKSLPDYSLYFHPLPSPNDR